MSTIVLRPSHSLIEHLVFVFETLFFCESRDLLPEVLDCSVVLPQLDSLA